ncbi:hypothetical protein WME98_46505 [Sorangium sp. So ce296]|uniref:hypothetical protein n=1 Tax=Sorangium sp. So ce296 TaxID=3133296 RepID=UPI003F5F1384
MNTVRKLCESDEQGTVHVELPIGAPHRRVEIVLVWQEIDEARTPPEALDKKRAEIEALAGALSDDPMARPAQPLSRPGCPSNEVPPR